uniref:DUF4838 domain-containing protein n=1 Tax=uncultured Acetatifactor sp. TaxID=1671927 RepID=UPI00272C2F29
MKTRIYQNGISIRIRVAPDATPQETCAAQELGSYLERMTSTAFDAAEADYDGPVIAIGRAAERYGVSFDGRDDDFLLKTVGENLCIAGGKRGVIYGVYEVLERLGCRFFTATCEKVPFADELVLEELDEAHSPDFTYREHNYYEPRVYAKFAVKSRLNGQQHPISEKYGGHIQYSWFVHSFENIVSPEEYGEAHPEYFAMDKEGVRMLTPYK